MWETWVQSLPTPVSWSGEFQGLYSPWGCKEFSKDWTTLLWGTVLYTYYLIWASWQPQNRWLPLSFYGWWNCGIRNSEWCLIICFYQSRKESRNSEWCSWSYNLYMTEQESAQAVWLQITRMWCFTVLPQFELSITIYRLWNCGKLQSLLLVALLWGEKRREMLKVFLILDDQIWANK